MEAILAQAVTDYTFSYVQPSLLAASAIHLVLSKYFSQFPEKLPREFPEIQSSLCKITKSEQNDVNECVAKLTEEIPEYFLSFPLAVPGCDVITSADSGSQSSSAYGSYDSNADPTIDQHAVKKGSAIAASPVPSISPDMNECFATFELT